MRHILDKVWDFAEWTDAIQEVIQSGVEVIPEPVVPSEDKENVDKENIY